MKRTIDWSGKHNILIKNNDGSYLPMDEPYYEAEPVTSNVWKILSSGDYSYCIKGKSHAVAIDTGYGAGNIRDYLEKLTGVPVNDVINTHDHFDHTANNGYFDHAYMGKKGLKLATVPFKSFDGISFIQDYERIGVEEGYVYDLDGKELEIFDIPDHAVDSIAILDAVDRVLFTGDEFMMMGKILDHASLREFLGFTEKLLARKADYEYVCGGNGIFNVSFLQSFHDCAEYILSGNTGKPFAGKVGGPGKLPEGPNGETVYDRQMPHYGDGGADKMGENKKTKYCMEYAGTRIIYDLNEL